MLLRNINIKKDLSVTSSFLFCFAVLELGFTPCMAEQPLHRMEMQEKNKDKEKKHLTKLTRKNPKLKGAY